MEYAWGLGDIINNEMEVIIFYQSLIAIKEK